MNNSAQAEATPTYRKIKNYVLEQIQAGAWKEGDAIPAEEALAREFGVSRMTVNRAIRELGQEQIVERRQGAGTFVAQRKYQATLVEIRNIADEIASRGHRHHSELQLLERTKANAALAQRFRLKIGDALFHSIVVHFEDGVPIQVEDRFVNPVVAPDYLAQDFRSQTPNAYLMRVAPLQRVNFEIEASVPPKTVSELLEMGSGSPCLVLHRETFSMGSVASTAAMWHPASRYKFVGSF